MFKPFEANLPLRELTAREDSYILEMGEQFEFELIQANLVAEGMSDDVHGCGPACGPDCDHGEAHDHDHGVSVADPQMAALMSVVAMVVATDALDAGVQIASIDHGDHSHSAGLKGSYEVLMEDLAQAYTDGEIDGTLDSLVTFAAANTGLDIQTLTEKVVGTLNDLSAPAPVVPLSMTDTVAGDSSTTAVIEVGGRVEGTTEEINDQDWYRVDLEAGVEYAFIMLRAVGDNPHADPLLRLFGTDGTTQVAMNDDAESGGNGVGQSSLFTFTPDTSGTFYLVADGWQPDEGIANSTGEYVLFVEPDNGRPDGTIEEAAFFLTDGFSPRSQWDSPVISYNLDGVAAGARPLILQAFEAWADIAPFVFVPTTLADADIYFTNDEEGAFASSRSDGNGFYIRGDAPNTTDSEGNTRNSGTQVNIEADWDQNTSDASNFTYDVNSYLYQTIVHEIGHALGLGHGGPYNSAADYGVNNVFAQDSWNLTVMSYFDQGEAGQGTSRLALGPQIADIFAIQDLYGANTTSRSGDTVYGFNSTESDESLYNFLAFELAGTRVPTISIFDTGGIDTLDVSFYEADQTISLVPGTFSSIGDNTQIFPVRALDNVISIAVGTVIENAVGGSGDDVITGNDADNVLMGMGGDDELFGGDGDDVAVFRQDQEDYTITENNDGTWTVEQRRGDGEDTLTDIEVLRFRDGDRRIADAPVQGPTTPTFTQESDTAQGTDEAEILDGLAGDDNINGGGGNDTLRGSFGADTLDGGEGNDLVLGDVVYALDNVEGQVWRAYQAVFDRAPDPAGFAANRNAIVGGVLTQEDVIASFVDSEEFQLTYGSLDNRAFVEQLYRNVLDREGDAGGIDAFTGALDGGRSRASVVVEFANSPEFIQTSALQSGAFASNNIADPIELQVFRAYQAVFDRAPDNGGFVAFSDAIKGGALTIESVIAEFVGSDEFQLTYGDLGNEAFVQLLYQNVLDRDADAEGLAAFTGALNGGRSRESVVIEFSESAEFIFNTDAAALAFSQSADVFASDTLIDSAGDDTYFGGAGSDEFRFDGNGSDIDTILDMTPGVDQIVITGNTAVADFDALVANAVQVGNDVVIDMGNGGSLILSSFQLDWLAADDFAFSGTTTVAQVAQSTAGAAPLSDFETDVDLPVETVTTTAQAAPSDVAASEAFDMLFEPDYDFGL